MLHILIYIHVDYMQHMCAKVTAYGDLGVTGAGSGALSSARHERVEAALPGAGSRYGHLLLNRL